jgi:hypothetical protein
MPENLQTPISITNPTPQNSNNTTKIIVIIVVVVLVICCAAISVFAAVKIVQQIQNNSKPVDSTNQANITITPTTTATSQTCEELLNTDLTNLTPDQILQLSQKINDACKDQISADAYLKSTSDEQKARLVQALSQTQPKVGTDVKLGDLNFTVSNVIDHGASLPLIQLNKQYENMNVDCSAKIGHFVTLEITVKNNGSTKHTLLGTTLFSSTAEPYAEARISMYCDHPIGEAGVVNAGATTKFYLFYDLPTKVSKPMVEFFNQDMSNPTYAYVSLEGKL